MTNELVDLGFAKQEVQTNNSMTEVAESRAQHEVQAAYVIAKKFPRNQMECYANIIEACKRPFLAEHAMYAYPRGGTLVEGASIRLAEVLSQNWGNMDAGIREISQSSGVSVCEAFAVDLQTNARKTIVFHVKHERHTKSGVKKLTDPRDIYELVANQGARRLRSCILALIPGDVQEAAVNQVRKTLESSDVPISEQIRKMVLAFDELGVKVEHLEKRLGHKLDATIPTEIVTLKGIYKSLKDGMADRTDYFDIAGVHNTDAVQEVERLIQKKKAPDKVNIATGELINV